MLDLSIRNRQGKTVLHYLVEHKDEENFRILLDREELTAKVANIPDKEGKTPMIYCLTKGKSHMMSLFCLLTLMNIKIPFLKLPTVMVVETL